jgi:cytochrome c biogenesis protein CcmG/thiol:disulfide interchange protein DsbE
MLNRIIIILAIIAAAIGYSVCQKRVLESELAVTAESILSKLPEGSFETLEGQPFNPHELYQSAVGLLLVHYWGTWCAPCEAELPALIQLINRFEARTDVKFLIVAVNDEKMKVQKHLKTLNLPKGSVLWLLDNKNVHRDIYGTTRVPETYLFSSDKRMLKKYVGPQEWSKPLYFQTFDEFLQISSSKL